MSQSTSQDNVGITLEIVRQVALSFPGIDEVTTPDSPVFKIKHCMFAHEAEHELAGILALKVGMREAEFLIEAEPEIYYLTPRYRQRCDVLIRMSAISPTTFKYIFENAWRRLAAKRDIAAYEKSNQGSV